MSTQDPSSTPETPPILEAEAEAPAEPIESNENESAPSQDNKLKMLLLRAWSRLPQERPKGLFWLLVLATSTLTGAIAFQWLTGLPPTPNCSKLFKATLSDAGQLYCADQAARKGDEASLSAALTLAGSISSNDPLLEQSKRLADHWSQAILVLARQKVEAGDLKKGIQLAQKVPKSSKHYPDAQAMIQDWQRNWKDGEEIFRKAKEAIQNQDWSQATEQVRDLVQIGSDYWQGRADKIVSEISVEQQEFLKINSAQELVNYGTPDDIAKAIQMASQVNPKRLARKRVAEKIDDWSQKLVDIAKDAQSRGDYELMIDAARKVPPTAKPAKVAASYLQLGQAEAVTRDDDSLWSAIQAYSLFSQIETGTPAYEVSKDQQKKWQDQVQNKGQLALANWFASFDQLPAYRAAIAQAALVASDQPRRVQAQTQIAFWNKQIETFPNRQFIARAKQMAVDNTVASLEAAIAEAGKILSGQPLRDAAQTLIAQWNSAIERVQDQPILDQAIALAKTGDLNGAIQIADKIAPNRALYADAQAKVGEWVAQIQSVEDRPILNDAEALARDGRLSEAIARASDIGSSRALYGEAQARIGDWAAQRRQIEEANNPPPPIQEESPQDSGDQGGTYSDSQSEPVPPEELPPSNEAAAPPPDDGAADVPPADTGTSGGADSQSGSNPNF